MQKYALICINYNSYPHLLSFLQSVEVAAKASRITPAVVVVDNSTNRGNYRLISEFISSSKLDIKIIESQNIGYFPGAAAALNSIRDFAHSFDYISISNVDLRLDPEFFKEIEKFSPEDNVGVIAPSIISEKRKDDLNPKIAHRPLRSSLERTLKIFNNVVSFYAYRVLSDWKSRARAKKGGARSMEMYAPHGSFIIFTKNYFSRGGNFDYPRFLFGEEIFVGETCIALKLKIQLNTKLKVYDIDHGSTSLKSLTFLASEHAKSLHYLLQKYFSED